MATAGSLDFVLTANSTQLRQELGKVRQESQSTALAITNLFSGDTINAVGFKVARGTITGLIGDIDEMNAGLSLSESLTRNLAASFGDLGDIALLQLGQIASFLGDDLFQTPLAGLQGAALERVGLGQLEGAFQIITAGSNAAKVLEAALGGVAGGLNAVDSVLGNVQGNAQSVSNFFKGIAGNAQLASSVLVGTAKVIDAVIEELLDTLAAINPAFKQTRDAAKALGIEFSVGQAIFGDYINDLNKLDQAASTAANASQEVADGAEAARRGVDGAGDTISDFGRKLESQQKAAAGFESAIRDLADAGQLLDIYNQANGAIEQFTGSLEDNFNAAKGAENLRNKLELVSKSAGGAGEDLGFVRDLTNDLGVNFDAAAQGYAQFSTAANLANLSVQQTKDTFEGITQATSVFGLSAADTQGTFLALQQSLSSGNVQLEELNQISERIPGTFQAAAAALGVTTGELKGLISTGKVSSAEFLPKFAEQLKAFTEAGVVDSMNSGEAAVNRFNNSLMEFQVAAGQAWLEVGTPALNTFSEALKFAAQNEELFSTAIDAVLVASLPLFISSMAKAATAVTQFIVSNKTATISLFGQQISATAAQIGKFGAQVALTYAAILVFYEVARRFEDGGKEVRESIASIDRVLLDLEESSHKAAESIRLVLPKDPPPTGWIDAIVHGFNEVNEATNRFFGIDDKFGNFTTDGEKQLKDLLVAVGDFSQRAQEVLRRGLDLETATRNGTGAINTLKAVDAQLKQIQQRRLTIDPKDTKAIAALAAEEEALLKRRRDAQQEIQGIQKSYNVGLQEAKTLLQNLEIKSEGDLEVKRNLELQISLLEKGKARYEDLTNTAEVTAESIASNFEKATNKLDTAFSAQQADLEESLASKKVTEEEYRQQQLEEEKKYLEDRLKLNRETAEKLRTELENNAKLKAIDPSKVTLTTEEEEEYKKQLEQIDLDTAKTRIDIAKNVQTTRQQLNDEELAKVRENQAEAEAIMQRSENDRIAAIKQRQAAGQLSEQEANRQIEDAQKASIANQIQAEKDKLKQNEELKQNGVRSTEEAATEEREILGRLSDLNLQRIDAELQARKAANDEVIQDLEEGIKQAEAAINQSKNSRQQSVGKSRLAGTSEEDAARESLRIEQDTVAQSIALKQRQIQENEDLARRGVRSEQEAADIKRGLISEIGDLSLQQINNEIQAQQNLIDSVRDGAQQQTEIASLAANDRITAVKQAQAEGVLSEQAAAEQISQIQADLVDENLRIKAGELARIQQQRKAGELTIKESADLERAIIGEISGFRQQAADAELAAQEQVKQTKLDAIDQELQANQLAADAAQGVLQLKQQAIEEQNNLMSAQLGLLQAQTSLTQQRLQNQIESAEKAGDTNRVEALRKTLIDEQIRAQQKQATIELEQIKLQQTQNQLALVEKQINAENALLEAQAALETAKINGATERQIDGLQRMLNLRLRQLDALGQQAANQQKINQLELEALKVKQQQTREGLAQQKIQQQQAQIASASASSGVTAGPVSAGPVTAGQVTVGLVTNGVTAGNVTAGKIGIDNGQGSGSRSISAAFGGGGSKPATIGQITDKITDLGRNGDLATAFNASNLNLGLKLGFGDIGKLSTSIGASNGDILGKLDQLISATKQNGNRPNLSISNVNDLGMAGQIYSDISRDNFRSADL